MSQHNKMMVMKNGITKSGYLINQDNLGAHSMHFWFY